VGSDNATKISFGKSYHELNTFLKLK